MKIEQDVNGKTKKPILFFPEHFNVTHASLVVCKLNAASEIQSLGSMAIYCGSNINFLLERICYTVVLYLNIAVQSRTAQCQH